MSRNLINNGIDELSHPKGGGFLFHRSNLKRKRIANTMTKQMVIEKTQRNDNFSTSVRSRSTYGTMMMSSKKATTFNKQIITSISIPIMGSRTRRTNPGAVR